MYIYVYIIYIILLFDSEKRGGVMYRFPSGNSLLFDFRCISHWHTSFRSQSTAYSIESGISLWLQLLGTKLLRFIGPRVYRSTWNIRQKSLVTLNSLVGLSSSYCYYRSTGRKMTCLVVLVVMEFYGQLSS